jgi:hypothetical protein
MAESEYYKFFKDAITNIAKNISTNESDFFTAINAADNKHKTDAQLCLIINVISMYTCIIFIFYYYVYVTFVNSLTNSFLNSYRINASLGSYSEYAQLNNIFYFTENFSIDCYALVYLKLLIIIIATIIYIAIEYPEFYKDNSMPYITAWTCFGILLLLAYFTGNSSQIIQLSNKNNRMMNLIYNHISKDYLEDPAYSICNYFVPEENSDVEFELNKCNNFKVALDNDNVYEYIENLLQKAAGKIDATKSTLTFEQLKDIIDDDDISFLNKIISALFTNTLISYFMKNNLKNEAAEFFSIDNLNIDSSNTFASFFSESRKNPLLYIRINNITLLESNYIYESKLTISKSLFFNIIQEYNKLENNISNIIVDIISRCKNKVTPPDTYYDFITYFMIILLVVYIITNSSSK